MRYLFEDYVLDTDRRELRRGTGLISLTPQVFDLLAYVIKNRELVVSKDDLIVAVWGGRIVSDSALTTRINAARSAIGDSGEQQRLIKTLPRKGFRFVGSVREGEQLVGADATNHATPPPKPSLTLPDKPSIAVLPFTNLSGDARQEYFIDGVVEDIITELSRFSELFVIARNSSFTYKERVCRCPRRGTRPWGALRAGGQRTQSRKSCAHDGAAHRCCKWGAHLGRPLRKYA